jgi:hypothetical protein
MNWVRTPTEIQSHDQNCIFRSPNLGCARKTLQSTVPVGNQPMNRLCNHTGEKVKFWTPIEIAPTRRLGSMTAKGEQKWGVQTGRTLNAPPPPRLIYITEGFNDGFNDGIILIGSACIICIDQRGIREDRAGCPRYTVRNFFRGVECPPTKMRHSKMNAHQ